MVGGREYSRIIYERLTYLPDTVSRRWDIFQSTIDKTQNSRYTGDSVTNQDDNIVLGIYYTFTCLYRHKVILEYFRSPSYLKTTSTDWSPDVLFI